MGGAASNFRTQPLPPRLSGPICESLVIEGPTETEGGRDTPWETEAHTVRVGRQRPIPHGGDRGPYSTCGRQRPIPHGGDRGPYRTCGRLLHGPQGNNTSCIRSRLKQSVESCLTDQNCLLDLHPQHPPPNSTLPLPPKSLFGIVSGVLWL